MTDRYPAFFEELFSNEGAFQNDPNDRGNYHNEELYGTIYGVTARDHFPTFMTLYLLYNKKEYSAAKEHAMEFYRRKGYWNDLYNEIIDSSLAFKLFDFGVNAGPERAVKFLQEILYTYWWIYIEADGVFGRLTLNAVNQAFGEQPKRDEKVELIAGESLIYSYYVWRLEKYYRSLKTFWRFGKGWLNRLKKVFNKVQDLPPNP